MEFCLLVLKTKIFFVNVLISLWSEEWPVSTGLKAEQSMIQTVTIVVLVCTGGCCHSLQRCQSHKEDSQPHGRRSEYYSANFELRKLM